VLKNSDKVARELGLVSERDKKTEEAKKKT